jgi:polysaccharide export outer membrane protein
MRQIQYLLNSYRSAFIACLMIVSTTSCRTPQEVVYWNDSTNEELSSKGDRNLQTVVQWGDQLYLFINASNVEAVEAYNLANFSSSKMASNVKGSQVDPVVGYTVDKDGTIDILRIGKVSVIGKSLAEIKTEVETRLKDYLIDPIVTIRILNFHVTVLGEVNMPGTYNIPYARVDVFQALGFAGDMTINGKRQNIMVVRQTDQGKKVHRLDLTKKSSFSDEFFYLQSGDIVYVEPNRVRINNGSVFLQVWPTIASAATLAILIMINLK